jgi:hypothetical protein
LYRMEAAAFSSFNDLMVTLTETIFKSLLLFRNLRGAL